LQEAVALLVELQGEGSLVEEEVFGLE